MTKKVTEKHNINGHDPEFPIRLTVMYRESGGEYRGSLPTERSHVCHVFQTFVLHWDSMIEITKGMFLKVYKG